jgi:triacylglycerol lipase
LSGRRRSAGGFAGVGRVGSALVFAAIVALGSAASASAAPSYPEAVVLVSGFDTQTPFTTPDPSCNGMEGEAWDPPTGVAAALKAAGKKVFTAPVHQAGGNGLTPCDPDGPAPPQSDYIDSNGEVDANGAALAGLLAFLRDNYGVQRVELVGHSDGGLWSRSAISQDGAYAGVSVLSLTTLGTPHTGSFIADLAIDTEGAKCEGESELLRLLCLGLRTSVEAIVDDLGQSTTEELTNDYLATWNPLQTIGKCPVTGIAGTFLGGGGSGEAPFPYYVPDDGLVGEASALARSAQDIDGHTIPAPPIPNFRAGGTYPVVHGASMKYLSKESLLNTEAISAKVVEVVGEAQPSGPLCNVASGATASVVPATQSLRLPLTRLVLPTRRGYLPAPHKEDAVIVRRGVQLTCGAHGQLPLVPLLGDERLRIGQALPCGQRLVARRGVKPRGGALLIRRDPHRDVILKLRGDGVRLRVRGPRPQAVWALLEAGGKWTPLPLDRFGRGVLPSRAPRSALRIRVKPQPGARIWTATAVLRH